MSRNHTLSSLAALSLGSVLSSPAWAATYNPLADRAATLGGTAFTVERASGSPYQASNGQTDRLSGQSVGNPLAERAATLDGQPFVVQRENNAQNHAAYRGAATPAYEPSDSPLADRAATLGGKPFVVDAGQREGTPSSFLAVVH
jgi:hypothetical protein